MVGRDGKARIQEELDGQLKTYTHEEWQKELERRAKAEANNEKAPKSKKEAKPKSNDPDDLIKDDTDEDEDEDEDQDVSDPAPQKLAGESPKKAGDSKRKPVAAEGKK